MAETNFPEELNKDLTPDSNAGTGNVEHQIENEMIPEIAPEEQTRDAASKSGEPVNKQASAENPAPSAGSDPTKSTAHAGDGTINITTESETGMVFPRAIPQDAMAVLDELERERALQSLQNSGYLDEGGRPTDKLLKKIHRFQRRAKQPIRVEVSYRVLMADLVKAGIKFAFAKSNRLVHQPHVDSLYNSVQDTKDKCFVETGKIVEARLLLEEGLELVDENGNELTLDTEDIDDYFAVLDSQHRFIVARNHCDVSLMLEIPDYLCPSTEYISIINNEREDWNGVDRKHAIIELKGESVSILQEMETFKETFHVSDKYAEMALTGKKDRFKTDELVEIQLGKKEPGEKFKVGTEMKDRAYNVMYAVLTAFGPKEKRIRKIQCIDALYNILDYLDDDHKKVFDTNIVAFLVRGIDAKDKEVFLSKVADAAKEGDPDKFIWQKYNAFVKSCSDDDFEIIYNEATSEIEKVKNELESESEPKAKRKTPKLKMGTPSEILANMKTLAAEDEKKKKNVAVKSAEKVLADAKVKADEMEDAK